MLIRVFEIPSPKYTDGVEPYAFVEVDWFQDAIGLCNTVDGRHRLREFIENKAYFDPEKAYLVLHPMHSFTIGYEPK